MQFSREQKKKWFKHSHSDAEYLIGFLPHAAHKSLIEQISAEVAATENPLPAEKFSARLLSSFLFGWKNVVDSEGEPIPFSFEAIDQFFQNDFSGVFHAHARWITEKALDAQAFDDSEQVLKNLSAPSNGAARTHAPRLHTA